MPLSDPERGIDAFDRLPIVSEVLGSIVFTTAALFAWNNAFRILPFSDLWCAALIVVGALLFTPTWLLLRRLLPPLKDKRLRAIAGAAGIAIVLFSFTVVGDARRAEAVSYFDEHPGEVMETLRTAIENGQWVQVETIVAEYADVADPEYLELEAEARRGLDRWYAGLPN